MAKDIATDHACQRYAERVRPCTQDEARAALSSDRIKRAIAFGAGSFASVRVIASSSRMAGSSP